MRLQDVPPRHIAVIRVYCLRSQAGRALALNCQHQTPSVLDHVYGDHLQMNTARLGTTGRMPIEPKMHAATRYTLRQCPSRCLTIDLRRPANKHQYENQSHQKNGKIDRVFECVINRAFVDIQDIGVNSAIPASSPSSATSFAEPGKNHVANHAWVISRPERGRTSNPSTIKFQASLAVIDLYAERLTSAELL